MEKERKICSEGPYGKQACPYAKVVEEKGEFPSISYSVDKDGKTSNVRTRVDTECWCVYCTHPSHEEEKFIGGVYPYISCDAPYDCPELQNACENTCEKKTIWKRLKKFFFK